MDTTTTTAPAVHTWANGYGVWHAAIRETDAETMDLIDQHRAARAAIVAELADRGASPDYLATMPVVQVITPALTVAWTETYDGDDRAAMTTDQVCHRCGRLIVLVSGAWTGDLGNVRCDDGRRHDPTRA